MPITTVRRTACARASIALGALAALAQPVAAVAASDRAPDGSAELSGPRSEVVMPRVDAGPPLATPFAGSDGVSSASSATPPRPEVKLYGPPLPQVEKGKLAQVAWSRAPDLVPAALEVAVGIVTRNYPSVKAARAALRAAAKDVKAANWLRFPSFSGSLAYLDQDLNPEPQFSIEQPIWAGGRISAGIHRAKASSDVASADYVATIEQLALTTAQTYFEISRLTQREHLLGASLKEHNRLVQTMERRVAQEVSPLADLDLARSRAAQIEQDYTATRSQRATALRVFAELVADPTFDLGPVPHFDASRQLDRREDLEGEAVAFDPNLLRLAAQADVATAELSARKAAILPQINLQYSYDDVFKSRVGLVVRAQTTGGLSQISEIDSARLRIQTTLEARREAEQKLRRDIAADLIEYDAARARAMISTRASETAARVSESYTRQFIAGRRSWLDVMNALREAVNAQAGKTDAENSAQAAAVRLLLRSGRWRPNFEAAAQSVGEEEAGQDFIMGQM